MPVKIIGKVETTSCGKAHDGKITYEELSIEWKIFISSFDIHVIRNYRSPAFTFSNNSWFLMLYPKASNTDDMALYLRSKLFIRYAVEYTFDFKKHGCGCVGLCVCGCFISRGAHGWSQENGGDGNSFTGILQGDQISKVWERTHLWNSIKGIYNRVPSRVLTITCKLKRALNKLEPQTLTRFFQNFFPFREDTLIPSSMPAKKVGKIETTSCGKTQKREKTYEETNIEWKINISSFDIHVIRDYHSPAFSFANNSWFFKLFPKSSNTVDMTMYLESEFFIPYAVEYSFGVKKLGSVEQSFTGILQGQYFSASCELTKLWELIQRKSQQAGADDVLTVSCTLKHEIIQQSVLEKPKVKNMKSLEALSEDFSDRFANKESCDTTLCVQDKEYKVHRAVLIARSAVFAAMFQHEMAEKRTGIIAIPDCEPESFQQFLEYLYCDKLHEISFHSAFHLYITSDKYNVQKLKAICLDYLMQCITEENICDIVILADKYEETELFIAAQDFFNRNLNQILETSQWECLLKDNYLLANKLLKEMSLNVEVVDCRGVDRKKFRRGRYRFQS